MSFENLIANLDKRKGISSQEAVTEVKRLLGASKAGHAGTLDPMATGVLLICLGEATKIARFLSEFQKEYAAVLRLGQRTDTLDAEGEVIEDVGEVSIGREEVEEALGRFRGTIMQTPPMYSAVKYKGERLYKLARKGMEVQRTEREVKIHSISLSGYSPPFAEIRVSCSKGTYIRSLADDIGRLLGVGAYLSELRRTKIGGFSDGDSASIEKLPFSENAFATVDGALGGFAELTLSQKDYRFASNGAPFPAPEDVASSGGFLRLKSPEGRLFAIGTASKGQVRIERMLRL